MPSWCSCEPTSAPLLLGTVRSSPGTTPLAASASVITPTIRSDSEQPLVRGNRMPAQGLLRDVRHDERRAAVVFFELLDRGADVLLLQRLEVERVVRLEHALQHALQPRGRVARVVQRLAHFGQLADRAHADFVPVEVVGRERLEHALGRFVGRVLQAARKQQVLQQRAVFAAAPPACSAS